MGLAEKRAVLSEDRRASEGDRRVGACLCVARLQQYQPAVSIPQSAGRAEGGPRRLGVLGVFRRGLPEPQELHGSLEGLWEGPSAASRFHLQRLPGRRYQTDPRQVQRSSC